MRAPAAVLGWAAAAAAAAAPATYLEVAPGVRMPMVLLGTWYFPMWDNNNATSELNAGLWLEAGGRGFDTALEYMDPGGIGRAIRASGVPRDEIFIETKIPGPVGYDAAFQKVRKNLDLLGVDQLDMVLIHEPGAKEKNADTWRALEEMHGNGTLRAIGVANFCTGHLTDLLETARVRPMLNQVERHVGFNQSAAVAFGASHGIPVMAYNPLANPPGGVNAKLGYCLAGELLLRDPVVTRIAAAHGVTAAQVELRWHVQAGVAVCPRVNNNTQHMRENLAVMAPDAFTLTAAEMSELDTHVPCPHCLGKAGRCYPNSKCPENTVE